MNNKSMWITVIGCGIMVYFVLVSLLYKRNIYSIINFLEYSTNFILKQNIFCVLAIFTILEAPFYFLILPGHSLFVLIVSFYIRDFF